MIPVKSVVKERPVSVPLDSEPKGEKVPLKLSSSASPLESEGEEAVLARLKAIQASAEERRVVAARSSGLGGFGEDFIGFSRPSEAKETDAGTVSLGGMRQGGEKKREKNNRIQGGQSRKRPRAGSQRGNQRGARYKPMTAGSDSESLDSELNVDDSSDSERDSNLDSDEEEEGEVEEEEEEDMSEDSRGSASVEGGEGRTETTGEHATVGFMAARSPEEKRPAGKSKSSLPGEAGSPAASGLVRHHASVCEFYHRYGFAQHALLSLPKGMTFRGPCMLFCLTADALADGHSLRARPLIVPFGVHVSVVPAKRRGTKTADLTGLVEGGIGEAELAESAELAAMDSASQAEFGRVDWSWVSTKIGEWKQRLGTLPTTILVIQKPELDEEGALINAQSPRFFSRFRAPGIEESLLPTSFPAMTSTADSTIAVVGSSNIGKSTLCRFLTNYFLSQQKRTDTSDNSNSTSNSASAMGRSTLPKGVLWVDLDLGQPEFGFPGSFSVHRVRHTMFQRSPFGGQATAADDAPEHLGSFYVGSPKCKCPLTVSRALIALCTLVRSIQEREQTAEGGRRKRGVPVVINTHGWVLSTGRRATLEALRRLKPDHIVHLLRPDETPEWLTGEAIGNPKIALNPAVVTNRFSGPWLDRRDFISSEGASPVGVPLNTAEDNWPVTIHRTTVHRDPKRKKAATLREQAELQQLGLMPLFANTRFPRDSSASASVPLSSLSDRIVHVNLSDFKAIFICETEEDDALSGSLLPCPLEAASSASQKGVSILLAPLLAHATVALGHWKGGTETTGDQRKSLLTSLKRKGVANHRQKEKGDADSQGGVGDGLSFNIPRVTLLQHVSAHPTIHAFGTILSSEMAIATALHGNNTFGHASVQILLGSTTLLDDLDNVNCLVVNPRDKRPLRIQTGGDPAS
jgi:hypothetical protein